MENKSMTFVVNGVSFEMMRVDGGSFTMGATPEMKDKEDYDNECGWHDPYDEENYDDEEEYYEVDEDDNDEYYYDEEPTHQVTLKGYYLGQTPVTQALWTAVMGNNPSKFKGDNHPVENVSWDDCQKFISKLNKLTGKRFRLPTEAEWEFAARGGNNSRQTQFSGSSNPAVVAWYNGVSGTHPVATKQANELGIYDMSGNVGEWCSDWYEDGYSELHQYNPEGPDEGYERVFRGGSWSFDAWNCRSSHRNFETPDAGFNYLGLRLCLPE